MQLENKSMDPKIESLESTTFFGKRFTRKQIALIQETVKAFPGLARRELGHTVCENLKWVTPKGTDSIQACLSTLEEMEQIGLFNLPAIKKRAKRITPKIHFSDRTKEQPEICCPLDQLLPIKLKKVTDKPEIEVWNEFMERYHYLKYKRPIGSHLRYFIISENEGTILGCLLFSFATLSLSCRDKWIGWEKKDRDKHLNLVINNNRFLLFPWVHVKQLASKVFSLVSKQIANDWEEVNGYRPLLLETFVDPKKFAGTCYLASNWQHIGETTGRKPSKTTGKNEIPQKHVFVYPLRSDFRAILIQEKRPPKSQRKKTTHSTGCKNTFSLDDPFVALWQQVMVIVQDVANQFDKKWQKRKRILNTMLLILFIFRLVFSKNNQGYGVTINELWDQCRFMKVPLPQSKPVAPSAFCNARAKLDEGIFKVINRRILDCYEQDQMDCKWHGHRLFAVDGTKINLPRQLRHGGYPMPSQNSHYPQGLVSCLYQLKSKLPYAFDLVSHADERKVALEHLQALTRDDVVVYDRGYFSYMMLYQHVTAGVHAVFRIPPNTFSVIEEFVDSNKTDQVVTLMPTKKVKSDMASINPRIKLPPVKLRMIKYVRSETTYILGTTFLDDAKYKAEEFPNVYHSRWGVEELYKISKILIDVEEFHSRTERGVRQELFAHFVLITMNRLFTNNVENVLNPNQHNLSKETEQDTQEIKVNFKNSLVTIARNMESLFLHQVHQVGKTLNTIFNSIYSRTQKVRPGRAYDRWSRKPSKKWVRKKSIKDQIPLSTV